MARSGIIAGKWAARGAAIACALLLSPVATADTPRGAGAALWDAQATQEPLHGVAVEHGTQAQDTAALEQEIASLGKDGNYAVAEPGPLDRVLRAAGRLPEPASWALMILGFGGIAGAMRHRIRKSDDEFNKRIRRITDGEE